MFVSPSDSIQETFGLSVIEAMASGLPVVASDWDGYRDLVEDGRTGFLVPTTTVAGATATATARLLIGELNYDHFLAECSQATAVDIAGMGAALTRLVSEGDLRLGMGAAGCTGRTRAFRVGESDPHVRGLVAIPGCRTMCTGELECRRITVARPGRTGGVPRPGTDVCRLRDALPGRDRPGRAGAWE